MGLRNCFKNFRRGCKRENDDYESAEPLSKKSRLEFSLSTDDEEIGEEEYKSALDDLETIYEQRSLSAKDIKTMKHLMKVTRVRRQEWIRKDLPLVAEVVYKFPPLATSKWVSYNFLVCVAKFIAIFTLRCVESLRLLQHLKPV